MVDKLVVLLLAHHRQLVLELSRNIPLLNRVSGVQKVLYIHLCIMALLLLGHLCLGLWLCRGNRCVLLFYLVCTIQLYLEKSILE